ncbi:hypothetical protein OG612_36325 [Streptomyces sp. NBC_01527]|uniref:hypothetical protein n=1 Tax=Streptomyces sp. NBC_01527 TaxID=2903894 RepID=UPI0038706D23
MRARVGPGTRTRCRAPLRVLAVHRLKRGRASGTEAEGTGHPEPPTADLRLLRASRVAPPCPAAAGVTGGTLVRIAPSAFQDVVDHLDGRPLRDDAS